MIPSRPSPTSERGIVLISSLLLLVLLTILGVSMFRSFGIEERIAGNLREKQRALNAAGSAMQYAEWWLITGNNVLQVGNCTAPVQNANINAGLVCNNGLANPNVVPWIDPLNGGEFGTVYTPPNMTVNNAPAANTYYSAPRYYISLVGPSATGSGNIYQIDAWGYAGTTNTVAVIESTYLVDTGVHDLGGR